MKDYYEILGIKRDAKREEIRKAYLELCKRFHPDKFRKLGKAEYEKALKQFTLINEAFNILYDPVKREEYDKKLREGKIYTVYETSFKAQALSVFKMGKEELEKGNYGRAIQYLRTAVKLNPEEYLFKGYLAFAYLKDGRKKEEILHLLMKVYSSKSIIKNWEALYISSKVFHEMGEEQKAMELIEIARKLNPSSFKIKRLHEEISNKLKKGIFKFFKF